MEVSASHSKTELDGLNLLWVRTSDNSSNPDVVKIFDETNASGDFVAQPHTSHSSDRTYANLINTDVTLSEGEDAYYKAIYPADIVFSNSIITLPKEQSSVSGELTKFPMYTESSSKSLQFKNLCSVVKLNLNKANTTISKIQIITDKYITGDFAIDWNGGTPTLTSTTGASARKNHSKVVTLTFDSPVSIDGGHDFYVYLPAGIQYDYFMVKVFDNKTYPDVFTYTASSAFTLTRNNLYTLSIPEAYINFNESDLTGLFTVSVTNGTPHKVSFSRGNLLYVNSTTYKFADNQYDHKEGSNPSYTTWLYPWGTRSISIYGDPTMTQQWNASGVSIQNGGESTWRCLTQREWRYLLSGRSTNNRMAYYDKDGNQVTTSQNARGFTLCKIGSVCGMLIFPDLFYWPLDNKEPTVFGATHYNNNNSVTNWNNVFSLTLKEWELVEGAGCVFLPTTGFKDGSAALNGETTKGAYWSSAYYDYETAKFMEFTPYSTSFADNHSAHVSDDRCAFRLVKDN